MFWWVPLLNTAFRSMSWLCTLGATQVPTEPPTQVLDQKVQPWTCMQADAAHWQTTLASWWWEMPQPNQFTMSMQNHAVKVGLINQCKDLCKFLIQKGIRDGYVHINIHILALKTCSPQQLWIASLDSRMHLSSFHLPVVLDQDTAPQQDAVVQIKHLGKWMQVLYIIWPEGSLKQGNSCFLLQ